jgi:hypothetical protein
MGDVFRKIMVHALGAKTQNADFGETCFIAKMEFIVLWCSVTNNGLPNNNPFHIHCNTVI